MKRTQILRLRAELKGNTLSGHASVYEQETYINGEGYEVIGRGAFDDVLKDESTDVRALFNHDASMLLGRQGAGTLRLSSDSEGLAFDVDLPDTQLGRDVRVLLERGDLDGASFGWIADEYETNKRSEGDLVRRHTRIKRLVDVSVVTFPAYQGATATVRSETFIETRGSQLIRARARLLKG